MVDKRRSDDKDQQQNRGSDRRLVNGKRQGTAVRAATMAETLSVP